MEVRRDIELECVFFARWSEPDRILTGQLKHSAVDERVLMRCWFGTKEKVVSEIVHLLRFSDRAKIHVLSAAGPEENGDHTN